MMTGKVFAGRGSIGSLVCLWAIACGNMLLPDSSQAILMVHTSTPSASIPILDFTTASDSLSVPVQAGIITDVDLRVYIDHESVGDLVIELLGPAPLHTSITLMDRPGTASTSGGHIVPMSSAVPILFDDQAAMSAEAMGMGLPPGIPVGQMQSPDHYFPSPDLLTGLNGQTVGGGWTLRVTDNFTGLSGQLSRWDLILTTQVDPSIPEPATTTLTILAGMCIFTLLTGRRGSARCGGPRSG